MEESNTWIQRKLNLKVLDEVSESRNVITGEMSEGLSGHLILRYIDDWCHILKISNIICSFGRREWHLMLNQIRANMATCLISFLQSRLEKLDNISWGLHLACYLCPAGSVGRFDKVEGRQVVAWRHASWHWKDYPLRYEPFVQDLSFRTPTSW